MLRWNGLHRLRRVIPVRRRTHAVSETIELVLRCSGLFAIHPIESSRSTRSIVSETTSDIFNLPRRKVTNETKADDVVHHQFCDRPKASRGHNARSRQSRETRRMTQN
jgi:hypothetical protein